MLYKVCPMFDSFVIVIRAMTSGVQGNFIMLTCPCDVHPLTPHFYIANVGFTRVYTEAVLTCTHNLCLSKNKKNVDSFRLKIIILQL